MVAWDGARERVDLTDPIGLGIFGSSPMVQGRN
jgi:hypothetical protein